MEKSIEMYDGKVFGIEVSEYALEKGYLDFRTLAKMLEDCILNNTVRSATMENWRIVAGEFDDLFLRLCWRAYRVLTVVCLVLRESPNS